MEIMLDWITFLVLASQVVILNKQRKYNKALDQMRVDLGRFYMDRADGDEKISHYSDERW